MRPLVAALRVLSIAGHLTRRQCSSSMDAAAGISFLNQKNSIQLDVDLMTQPGFSLDQLMELAGLSVASALTKEYSAASHPSVLIVAGPGNNGGDGLVAARHLIHFGYSPTILYPKRGKNDLFTNLVAQCAALGVPFLDELPPKEVLNTKYHVILDAIFGFSFKGWRGGGKDTPFDSIVATLKTVDVPLASVDVPSGWHVEQGNIDGTGLEPQMLISLTAPKLCARKFEGDFHYLGGRFVPPFIVDKYELVLPSYPGTEQCVKLPC